MKWAKSPVEIIKGWNLYCRKQNKENRYKSYLEHSEEFRVTPITSLYLNVSLCTSPKCRQFRILFSSPQKRGWI